jgi:cytochrome c-type biogenesis protein
MIITDITTAFILGLLTPLTAVCVLPLYPGFLAYVSSKFSGEESKKTFVLVGLLVSLGVIISMSILGLFFTTILQSSLTKVIGVISPIAFSLLIIISLFLIFDYDISKHIPRLKTPTSQNPILRSFLFGLFFGVIVIPCNPLFIAALFTRTLTISSFLGNMISFISFGFGMSFPLFLFSVLSAGASQTIIGWLSRNKRKINLISGLVMLVISVYYLFFVFKILGGGI